MDGELGCGGEAAALVERGTEVAAVEAALAAARSGSGRLVVIEGDAGLGKSALLALARDRAAAGGMRVLAASGLELEREFAFGLALRLFTQMLDRAGECGRAQLLTGPARAATALFDGAPPVGMADGVDRGAGLVHALRWLTVHVADRLQPAAAVLVAVDDAQWSDLSSLRFLLQLAGELSGTPVTVVLTARTGAPQGAAGMLARLRSQPGAVVLRPAPLSPAAVTALVGAAFSDPTSEFARACVKTSGGNPFYLGELLSAARADGLRADAAGAQVVADMVPEAVLHSVLLRLGALPPPARALAAALAVLGDGTPLRRAASLAGLGPRDAEEAADVLAAARIVVAGEPLSFIHPLIGAAVHEDLPALARSRAHHRAAILLGEEDAAPEAVAAHLLVCRPNADTDVVQQLCVAAERAGARGEYEAAHRFLERALAEPPPPELRTQVLIDRALAETGLGAPTAVAHAEELLDVLPEGKPRVQILQALARLRFARADFAGATAAAQQALDALEETDPAADEVLADQMLIATVHPVAATGAALRLQAAMQTPDRPLEPDLLATLVAWQLARGEPAEAVRRTARAALDRPDRDRFYGVATGLAVTALIYIDDLELAAGHIHDALERARRTGSLIGTGFAHHWTSLLRHHQGDLVGTISAAQATLDVCRAGWDACRGWVVPLMAAAHLERGDYRAAGAALRLMDDIGADRREHAHALHVHARLALHGGDPGAALVHAQAAGELGAAHGLTQPTLLSWRPTAAVAAAATGQRDLALELAGAEVDAARRIGAAHTLGAALRTAGIITGGEPGRALLTESVAVLEKSPAALARAYALVDLGAALRHAGDRIAAREPLRLGLEAADALQATPLAHRARVELHKAGGRRPRSHAAAPRLTPSERRIAELAATGTPTAEIARELYLSRKTIEWHLGNAFRKLGINSRAQLADAIA
jgi:DNA-binding CsgD family transcriptional regulator